MKRGVSSAPQFVVPITLLKEQISNRSFKTVLIYRGRKEGGGKGGRRGEKILYAFGILN